MMDLSDIGILLLAIVVLPIYVYEWYKSGKK